jgi:hypothetical protein
MSEEKFKYIWYPYVDEYGNDLYWIYDYGFIVKLSRNKLSEGEFVVIGYSDNPMIMYRKINANERQLALSLGLEVFDTE